jgi:hypothetical protein
MSAFDLDYKRGGTAAEDVLVTDGKVFDGIEVALLAWGRGSAGNRSSRFDADWDFIWVGNLDISKLSSSTLRLKTHTRAADVVSSNPTQQPYPRSTHAKEDSPLV